MFKEEFSNFIAPVVIPVIPVERDSYGAIRSKLPPEVHALRDSVLKEMGYEEGIKSIGKRGGFEAHNVDVYGYDTTRNLAVIQLRRAYRKREGYFTSVKRAYFLIGEDDGQLFSHALPSSPARIKNLDDVSPEAVVQWAESKIFGVPTARLGQIVRQGDIALVPVRSLPGGDRRIEMSKSEVLLRGSHRVLLDGETCRDRHGNFYIDGLVEIVHEKEQHKAIAAEGKYRIVRGVRGVTPWWIDAELGD